MKIKERTKKKPFYGGHVLRFLALINILVLSFLNATLLTG